MFTELRVSYRSSYLFWKIYVRKKVWKKIVLISYKKLAGISKYMINLMKKIITPDVELK